MRVADDRDLIRVEAQQPVGTSSWRYPVDQGSSNQSAIISEFPAMRFLHRDLPGQRRATTVGQITNGDLCPCKQCNHAGSQDAFHVRNTLAFANCRKGDRDDAQDHDPKTSRPSRRSGPERSRHRSNTGVSLLDGGVPQCWDVVISQSTDGRHFPRRFNGEFAATATKLLEWE